MRLLDARKTTCCKSDHSIMPSCVAACLPDCGERAYCQSGCVSVSLRMLALAVCSASSDVVFYACLYSRLWGARVLSERLRECEPAAVDRICLCASPSDGIMVGCLPCRLWGARVLSERLREREPEDSAGSAANVRQRWGMQERDQDELIRRAGTFASCGLHGRICAGLC
jgi:hypothetical protein